MSTAGDGPLSHFFDTLFDHVDHSIGVSGNDRMRRLRRDGFGPNGPICDTHASRRQRSYGERVYRGSPFAEDQSFAMRRHASAAKEDEEERQYQGEGSMSTAGKVLLGIGLAGVGFGLYKLGTWFAEQETQNQGRTNAEAAVAAENEEAWARSMIDREEVAKKERENMARAEAIRAQAEHDQKLRDSEQKLIEAGHGEESDEGDLALDDDNDDDDDDFSEIGLYDSRELSDDRH